MSTSEELLELAEQCANKLDLDDKQRHIPSFSDAEEQCEDEYEELLEAIHEDELFAPVDIQLQESLVEQIAAELPEDKRTLIVELADNHASRVAAAGGGVPPWPRCRTTPSIGAAENGPAAVLAVPSGHV